MAKQVWAVIAANLVAAPISVGQAGIDWAAMMARVALLRRLPEVTHAALLRYSLRCSMLVAQTRADTLRRLFSVHCQQSAMLRSAWTVARVALWNAGEDDMALATREVTEAVGALQVHVASLFERFSRDLSLGGAELDAWQQRFTELLAPWQPAVAHMTAAAIQVGANAAP
jgi:hypothetical protein